MAFFSQAKKMIDFLISDHLEFLILVTNYKIVANVLVDF